MIRLSAKFFVLYWAEEGTSLAEDQRARWEVWSWHTAAKEARKAFRECAEEHQTCRLIRSETILGQNS